MAYLKNNFIFNITFEIIYYKNLITFKLNLDKFFFMF